MERDERLIKLGDSWFSAKAVQAAWKMILFLVVEHVWEAGGPKLYFFS